MSAKLQDQGSRPETDDTVGEYACLRQKVFDPRTGKYLNHAGAAYFISCPLLVVQ